MMKNVFLLAFTLAVASGLDWHCEWGQSHWCSSLRAAKECGAFQHCMDTVWVNQKLPEDKTDVCTYCENIIQDARDFITNKQTQAQIKHFMESACSIIPIPQYAQQCKDTVDQDLDQLMQLISSKLDPQVVCSLIGLCQGFEDTVQHREGQVANRVSSIKLPADKLEPICTDCKKFMQDIKDMATSAATEKQIEQYLENNLCSQLGGLADTCKAMVEAYVPEIMELLTGDFDPAQLCQVMGFCNQTAETPRALLARMRLRKSPLYKAATMVADTAECEICKTIINELETLDKDKATQEEIEKFLKEKICSRLGALKGACEESVDEYLPELFELLAMELDPATTCKSLGFCSANSNRIPQTAPVSIVKPLESSAQCILCEFVMKELDSLLSNNATEAEIQAALDKVCSLLPTSISKECTDFIDTYSKAIFAILSQELDPAVVCATLQLCKQNKAFPPRTLVKNPELCGVCETLIQYLDSVLTQNATVQDIEKALDQICNLLPDAVKAQCDDIVKQYGPVIAQLVAQFADPKEVCTEIGLCGNTTRKAVHEETIVPSKAVLVGTDECTYGPAYWCASRENAERCKTVEHCRRHVWNN